MRLPVATELNSDSMIKFVDVRHQTESNFSIFPRDLIKDDSSFCSFILSAIDLQYHVYSLWKAFVKCPSLSANGIFDDVRYDVISTQRCCSVGLNFLKVYYTEVSGWFMPKITKLCLHLSKLCLYCGLFFPDTGYGVFESPFNAADSASCNLSSTHFFAWLSCLCILSWCLCSLDSWCADISCSFFTFILCLSSIAFHVLSVIHLSFLFPRLNPVVDSAAPMYASLCAVYTLSIASLLSILANTENQLTVPVGTEAGFWYLLAWSTT